MKPTIFYFVLAVILPCMAQADEESTPTDFSQVSQLAGSWQNQSGSTMTLNFDTNGGVTGYYVNRAAGTGCQNSYYPLVGRYNSNYISFSVSWSNSVETCNSATAWAGYFYFSNGESQIVTDWNLAYQGASGPAIESGSDTFTYTVQKKSSAYLDGR